MEKPGQALFAQQKALAEHYKDVETFHSQRVKTRKALSRTMMVVTGVALLGNLAQAWTIAMLFPLSKIVPVYLWIRQDGTVDSSVSMSQLPATQNKAVINAALWEYVRLREGYSAHTAQYNYDIVSAFSAPAVALQYQKWFNYPNPESPQILMGKKGTIVIGHISSSDIGPSIQQIRFTRTVTVDDHKPVVSSMTATVAYAAVDKLSAKARLTNPGGVIVTSYQSSEDSVK